MVDRNRPRQEINLDQAKAFGTRFSTERNSRNLSHQEVADALLLSKQQVAGLETANLQKFYSASLFSQAADKYAHFLGFTDRPSQYLLSKDPNFQHTVVEAKTFLEPPIIKTHTKRSIRTLQIITGISISIVTVVAGKNMLESTPKWQINSNPKATATAFQPPNNMSQPTSVPNGDQSAAQLDDFNSAIHLQFHDTCWVQVISKNGVTKNYTFHNGYSLSLKPSATQALIIGNAYSVTLTTANGPISLKPYISRGSQVARIIGRQVSQLDK